MTRMNKALFRTCLMFAAAIYGYLASPVYAQSESPEKAENHAILTNNDFYKLSVSILIGSDEQRKAALDFLVARNNLDIVPMLVSIMRIGGSHVDVEALATLEVYGQILRPVTEQHRLHMEGGASGQAVEVGGGGVCGE